MTLISPKTMDVVEKLVEFDTPQSADQIAERSSGNLRTIRTALKQLHEEGRVSREGRPGFAPIYRRVREGADAR